MKFIKKELEKLAPTDRRIQYRDLGARDSVLGLLLEVQPNGKKIFRFRRKLRGKNHNIKIGEFPVCSIENARKIAKNLSSELEQGNDPNNDKRLQRESLTINDVFDVYYESFRDDILKGKRRESSLSGSASTYRLHLKPKIGNVRVANFTHHLVKRMLSKLLAKHGYSIHNHSLTLLKSMFRRAELDCAIFSGLTKIDESQFRRERVLSRSELAIFMRSLEQESQIYQDCVVMLLVTGQRKAAVLSMRWRDIDIENGYWNISGKTAKNKKRATVPLARPAIEILLRRSSEALLGDEFVFPSTRSKSGHITDKSGIGGFWHRITSRAGFYCPGNDEIHLTIHDLRRTLATYNVRRGGSLQATSKLLGHSDLSITDQVYAHLDVDNVRAELEKTVELIIQPKLSIGLVVPNLVDEAKNILEQLTPEQRAVVIASMIK
jgi:integrase